MGRIWRAYDHIESKLVAVKLPGGADVRANDDLADPLIEAKATASLRHPGVVQVFDFGLSEEDDPYIVMELLAGENLRATIGREGGMGAIDAVRMLLPVFAALGCAHAHGVVHRDLKPDNIFLSRNDDGGLQPKVVDFGIAKMRELPSRLLAQGTLLGSPAYMSPEQALSADDVDERTDLWALAVVLYELIAGRTPWSTSSCMALLRAIIYDPAPSLMGLQGVDQALWSILERGLEKDRGARWQTSRAFAQALTDWLSSQGVAEDITGASLRPC